MDGHCLLIKINAAFTLNCIKSKTINMKKYLFAFNSFSLFLPSFDSISHLISLRSTLSEDASSLEALQRFDLCSCRLNLKKSDDSLKSTKRICMY